MSAAAGSVQIGSMGLVGVGMLGNRLFDAGFGYCRNRNSFSAGLVCGRIIPFFVFEFPK